ncbi:hypothetical protein PR048_029750 [Dryococelus australis]|uniref:Uncharacterized protein n=1 Tax=Dryococelus australis TaxID=614101 RepID=A0ABQ9GEA0_9NEOP|nr:hypothetical protein PR048_029750 [Dryococelus australis]
MCKCCKKTLKMPSFSTTSLIRHLDPHLHLKLKYKEMCAVKKEAMKSSKQSVASPIAQAMNSKVMLLSENPRSQIIINKIGRMIALDYQPFSVVDDRGFKELMETLEPRYQIPIMKYFSIYLCTVRHMEQALNHDFESQINASNTRVVDLTKTGIVYFCHKSLPYS